MDAELVVTPPGCAHLGSFKVDNWKQNLRAIYQCFVWSGSAEARKRKVRPGGAVPRRGSRLRRPLPRRLRPAGAGWARAGVGGGLSRGCRVGGGGSQTSPLGACPGDPPVGAGRGRSCGGCGLCRLRCANSPRSWRVLGGSLGRGLAVGQGPGDSSTAATRLACAETRATHFSSGRRVHKDALPPFQRGAESPQGRPAPPPPISTPGALGTQGPQHAPPPFQRGAPPAQIRRDVPGCGPSLQVCADAERRRLCASSRVALGMRGFAVHLSLRRSGVKGACPTAQGADVLPI